MAPRLAPAATDARAVAPLWLSRHDFGIGKFFVYHATFARGSGD